jgi:hypothetical protein
VTTNEGYLYVTLADAVITLILSLSFADNRSWIVLPIVFLVSTVDGCPPGPPVIRLKDSKVLSRTGVVSLMNNLNCTSVLNVKLEALISLAVKSMLISYTPAVRTSISVKGPVPGGKGAVPNNGPGVVKTTFCPRVGGFTAATVTKSPDGSYNDP